MFYLEKWDPLFRFLRLGEARFFLFFSRKELGMIETHERNSKKIQV